MVERLTRQKFIRNCDAELTPCKLCSFECGDDDKAECWEMAVYNRLAAYEDLGPVEEFAALKEAAERIVLMWDNCYIEPYSADVKDYIERMRKAIKEDDHADS